MIITYDDDNDGHDYHHLEELADIYSMLFIGIVRLFTRYTVCRLDNYRIEKAE